MRKRLLRAVLVEIIATIKGREIHLLLHWKGGDHSHLVVPRNRTGEHRWTTDAETGALLRDLARMPLNASHAVWLIVRSSVPQPPMAQASTSSLTRICA